MLKFNIKVIMEFRDAREIREIRKAKITGKSPEVQNSRIHHKSHKSPDVNER
jgi:hypothetical protein